MSAGVALADHDGLRRALQELAGRCFLGAVDGGDCIELVFADAGPGHCNLVTIHTSGLYAGVVAFGGVVEPEAYVDETRDWFAEMHAAAEERHAR